MNRWRFRGRRLRSRMNGGRLGRGMNRGRFRGRRLRSGMNGGRLGGGMNRGRFRGRRLRSRTNGGRLGENRALGRHRGGRLGRCRALGRPRRRTARRLAGVTRWAAMNASTRGEEEAHQFAFCGVASRHVRARNDSPTPLAPPLSVTTTGPPPTPQQELERTLIWTGSTTSRRR